MNMFTDQQIKEIAEELQIGMKCFIHKVTKQVVITFDWENEYFDEGGLEEEGIQELEAIQNDLFSYHEIERMPSHEAFEVMEDFINIMSSTHDPRLKISLIEALNKRRPFAHFKHIVESSSYREAWFTFRDQAHFDWVEKQLKLVEMSKLGED